MRPVFESPAEVLRTADAVMRTAQPAFTVSFYLRGLAYRARFVYPGRLYVYDKHSGELIAKSRPGKPSLLAKR